MADNYVIREKYTHVDVVDGQVMPVRGVVEAGELVAKASFTMFVTKEVGS